MGTALLLLTLASMCLPPLPLLGSAAAEAGEAYAATAALVSPEPGFWCLSQLSGTPAVGVLC